MTYAEIIAKVKAHRKVEKEQIQLKAMFTYKLGNLIGLAFNEPSKYPSTVKLAFEGMGIFDEEEKEPVKQDWRIMKERMQTYANLKKKRGESIWQ